MFLQGSWHYSSWFPVDLETPIEIIPFLPRNNDSYWSFLPMFKSHTILTPNEVNQYSNSASPSFNFHEKIPLNATNLKGKKKKKQSRSSKKPQYAPMEKYSRFQKAPEAGSARQHPWAQAALQPLPGNGATSWNRGAGEDSAHERYWRKLRKVLLSLNPFSLHPA